YSLGVGETLEFTLSFRPLTLPAQQVQVIASATGPPGFEVDSASASVATVTLESDSIYEDSFEGDPDP
ncbi:MAG: hypothetical protein R3200_10105, partial [Xanthomonadales bacterium]|nr:hypothetical protein [Xanthomonadales bacterium]